MPSKPTGAIMTDYRIRGNDLNGWVVDIKTITKRWSWIRFSFIQVEDWETLTSDGSYAGVVGWFCFPCARFSTLEAAENFIENHRKGYFKQRIINYGR